MVLRNQFNDSFKAPSLDDMMLGLYAASNYGSNAYCFAQAARIAAPSNDHAESAGEGAFTRRLKL
ncbi:MAG TPA: hypothetical protein VEF76_08460 [Patescibacteria group bacterium]|nr:hypothetical protein [Patescibacteria group bacterium]